MPKSITYLPRLLKWDKKSRAGGTDYGSVEEWGGIELWCRSTELEVPGQLPSAYGYKGLNFREEVEATSTDPLASPLQKAGESFWRPG